MRSWRLFCWLGLVVILSGTPARQAEAASDLARTLAELGDDDHVEEVDGGVGDDSLEVTRFAPADPDHGPGSDGWAPWSGDDRFALHFDAVPSAKPNRPRAAPPSLPRLADRSSRRQAWLGRFRF